ncbi:hypothetical protein N7495_000852 [Penicillium taxi]|uniref:uncharacterized protein n=1 Tax=Penicillium taxi TaxID=168475 RepID=UPI00254561D6|nr:uncharacterized protein N7495_000852 [Penicillium taxi]KAJ5908170.1 hypothetical protein N7495_000852 [Penicillium taxi]
MATTNQKAAFAFKKAVTIPSTLPQQSQPGASHELLKLQSQSHQHLAFSLAAAELSASTPQKEVKPSEVFSGLAFDRDFLL